jgi:hypothetical protein
VQAKPFQTAQLQAIPELNHKSSLSVGEEGRFGQKESAI